MSGKLHIFGYTALKVRLFSKQKGAFFSEEKELENYDSKSDEMAKYFRTTLHQLQNMNPFKYTSQITWSRIFLKN